MALSEVKIKNAKPREKVYRISDGQGLCIEIKPTGLKFWRYRYMIDGRATMLTIGSYPEIGLAEARRLHQIARANTKTGIDPVILKKSEIQAKKENEYKDENTFDSLYREWLDKRMSEATPRYRKQITESMDRDILPVIGHKPIKEVTAADVLSIMQNTITRIKATSPRKDATGESAAILNRQFVGAVCQYAAQTLRADFDPTQAVRRAVKKSQVQHARALSKAELSALYSGVTAYHGTTAVRGCLTLLLLTMTRSKEARHARWCDIDFDSKLWTIPAEMMKKRRVHIVPLSNQAIRLLKEHQQYSGNNDWVFPSPKHQIHPIGETTINRALGYLKLDDTTGHDFRSTASTVLNANRFNKDWIEIQLAHVEGNQTRRSYNHADYLLDRHDMLQWWADYLDSLKTGQ